MTNHFSELGSIIHSKACDTFDMYGISKDEIKMYYEILNSDEYSSQLQEIIILLVVYIICPKIVKIIKKNF